MRLPCCHKVFLIIFSSGSALFQFYSFTCNCFKTVNYNGKMYEASATLGKV